MFTGIIQATVPITIIEEKEDFRTHHVRLPTVLLPGLILGASVAHNGCCLTVTNIVGDIVSFDLTRETLQLTNLGMLNVGDKINLERAATLQAEIGGHLMSGHIICTAVLTKIMTSEYNSEMWFSLPEKKDLMQYILYKGYIGIDGISLTISEVLNNGFGVHLIPETLRRTTLGAKRLGDSVNIEIDLQTQAIVHTVKRFLSTSKCENLTKRGFSTV